MALGRKKEDVFFTMFKDFSHTLFVMGGQFGDFLKTYPEPADTGERMKQFESDCDSKKHAIIHKLNDSFVTPFDREDIFTIAEQLDDLADFMEDIASKFFIYDVRFMRPEAVELGSIIFDVTEQVERLFLALPDSRKNSSATDAIIKINGLENQGDTLFRQALTRLFRRRPTRWRS